VPNHERVPVAATDAPPRTMGLDENPLAAGGWWRVLNVGNVIAPIRERAMAMWVR
jgi:hypothetical protein